MGAGLGAAVHEADRRTWARLRQRGNLKRRLLPSAESRNQVTDGISSLGRFYSLGSVAKRFLRRVGSQAGLLGREAAARSLHEGAGDGETSLDRRHGCCGGGVRGDASRICGRASERVPSVAQLSQ